MVSNIACGTDGMSCTKGVTIYAGSLKIEMIRGSDAQVDKSSEALGAYGTTVNFEMWTSGLFVIVQLENGKINPLSLRDALTHHFACLKTHLIFPEIGLPIHRNSL